jgi:two-component system, chemotaxis family, protein-glutamate methylesterase/glutaminase
MINASQLRRDVVVIGGSAGSIEALLQLLGALPAQLPAAIGIVLHRSPHYVSKLTQVFQRCSRLPIVEPAHGEPISQQRVYIAPRDQHMLFDDGVVRVNRGPRQHFTVQRWTRCSSRPRRPTGRGSSAFCCPEVETTGRAA